ncbi:MAG: alkaline phosphatase [Stackebrandtia sp.]
MTSPEPDAVHASGHTRRFLFKAGGGTVAAATFTGLTASPAAASDAGAPAPANRTRSLSPRDPHAHTRRSRPVLRETEGPQIRILPVDNAKFRAGGRFDLRVEVTEVDPVDTEVTIKVKGPNGPASVLGEDPEQSGGDGQIVIVYPWMSYPEPGEYTVQVTVKVKGGKKTKHSVVHEVVGVGDGGAKNVIFFLGDGMGAAAVTAARLLSKGMTEGKYHGRLAMDAMDHRGLVGTSGVDSIATDSANSASAYMCGHKSSVNAMGVYESSEEDPNRHPRVETMAEMLKRTRGMSIGVVTTAEIQDASPAAVWAHTRFRDEKIEIMDQALTPEQTPDVLMGGGLAYLLPRSEEGSKREDDRNLVEEFKDLGFAYASNREELEEVAGKAPEKLLGQFHTGNLNAYLDRRHSKNDDVLGEWDDQPTLMEMTAAALKSLENSDDGFFLMVEGALIDKMEHPLDGPRAVYDTIELDQAVQVAKDWAADRDDTLIVVTADHNHSMSIVGTHDRRGDDEGRDANRTYGDAGFPTYADEDGDGFPDDPDPDVQLFFGWSNHPDHTDDFQHNEIYLPASVVDDDTGEAVDNPERDPDAELQIGNLPRIGATSCVHTVEDVSVVASGPGSSSFNGFLDNTELFHNVIDALGVDAAQD